MTNQAIKLNSTIRDILVDETFDHFTVLQLRDSYVLKIDQPIELSAARSIVYQQILRLSDLGLLKKKVADNPRKSTYSKTEKFHQAQFITDTDNALPTSPQKNIDAAKVGKPQDAIKALKGKLNQYQVDLLSSIGESEEYMQLYKTLPDMKSHLEQKYHHARENSSKLLGQIKAVESVLSHFQA
ncbi:MAG: hypothetical protein ACI8WB_003665 [Phenylobacterium sp.]|jgi:hypothetical protein